MLKSQGRGILLLLCAALGIGVMAVAGYKARPWKLRPADSYPARLTSEGVTIAIEPLYRDALAAQVFDKDDIVTRGIMPLGILIFNDNGFPVQVDSRSIELVQGEDRSRTLQPEEVVQRLFQAGNKGVWLPQPIPRASSGQKSNSDALEDFDHKFLGDKIVEPHSKAGGFLYLRTRERDLSGYLAGARVYIPDLYRQDTGEKMLFFEIEVQPALDAATPK